MKGRPSVFVRQFGKECIAKDLREKSYPFGTIMDIHIPRTHGESRGYGFVRFKREEDVEYLFKVNLEILVIGRKVFFAWAWKFGRLGANRIALMKSSTPMKAKVVGPSQAVDCALDNNPEWFLK